MLRTYFGLVGLQVLGTGLALVFLALVAAYIPADVFGAHTLILSVAQATVAIGLSWSNAGLLRVGREEYGRTGTMGGAFGSRVVMHALLLLIFVPALFIFEDRLTALFGFATGALPWLVTLMVVMSISEMVGYAAQARGRFSLYGLGPLALKTSQSLMAILFAVGLASGWPALVAATILGYALTALIAWRQLPGSVGRLRPNWSSLRAIMVYSWSLPFGAAGGMAVAWVGLWYLNHHADTATVGAYAWAYNVSLLVAAILTPLSAMLTPRLIDADLAAGRDGLTRYAHAAAALACLWMAILPLGMALALALFALLDFGGYEAALGPALIMIGATSFQFMAYLVNPAVAPHGELMPWVVLINLASAVGNIALVALLVPLYGAVGAALSMAGALGIAAWLLLVLARRVAYPPALLPVVLISSLPVAVGAIAEIIPTGAAIALCLTASLAGLFAARRFGALRDLGILIPMLSDLPRSLAQPGTRIMRWLAA